MRKMIQSCRHCTLNIVPYNLDVLCCYSLTEKQTTPYKTVHSVIELKLLLFAENIPDTVLLY